MDAAASGGLPPPDSATPFASAPEPLSHRPAALRAPRAPSLTKPLSAAHVALLEAGRGRALGNVRLSPRQRHVAHRKWQSAQMHDWLHKHSYVAVARNEVSETRRAALHECL